MSDQLPYYVKKKKKYTRVTHILKTINDSGLDSFKAGVSDRYYNEVMENARERGVAFHNLIEKYTERKVNAALLRGLEINRPELLKPFETFISWADDNVDKFLLVEKVLYNELHGYAGRPDFIAILKKRKTAILFDAKFKAALNFKENMQTAAYVPPAEELLGIKIPERRILQFNKNGKMKTTPFKDQATDFGFFLSVLSLHNKFNKAA